MMWIRTGIGFLTAATLVSATANAQFGAIGVAGNDWVSMWALNGRSEQQAAKQLAAEYQMRIKIMDRICALDQTQKKKLKFAAEADLSRFLRDVARTRRELEKMNIGNNNVQEAWEVVSPLATRLQAGLFDEGSLFDKVFRSSLDESQQQLYQAEAEKDRRRRWRAITRTNLADIERSMPLLAVQREKLLKLLDDVQVPGKLKKHMDGYVGYLRLIKVGKQELAEFLDEDQVAVIDQYRERYQGWARMFP